MSELEIFCFGEMSLLQVSLYWKGRFIELSVVKSCLS